MANQTGIAITIKAFLPTGKTLDEQFTALSLVKEAHANSDYSALLKAASVEEVKTEQKTRRIEDQPKTPEPGATGAGGNGTAGGETMQAHDPNAGEPGYREPAGQPEANDGAPGGGEPADADPNGDNLPASLKVKTGRRAA